MKLNKNDYVLATKWSDGDPNDHFAVGFYDKKVNDRYFVVDNNGHQFRNNGFRRIERISPQLGALIVNNIKLLEKSSSSIWYWRYHPQQLKKLVKKFVEFTS